MSLTYSLYGIGVYDYLRLTVHIDHISNLVKLFASLESHAWLLNDGLVQQFFLRQRIWFQNFRIFNKLSISNHRKSNLWIFKFHFTSYQVYFLYPSIKNILCYMLYNNRTITNIIVSLLISYSNVFYQNIERSVIWNPFFSSFDFLTVNKLFWA